MSRLTQGPRASVPIRGCHPLRPAFPDGSGHPLEATGLIRFRSPLLAESRLMSFPPATEMFQFAGFASRPYGFGSGSPLREGLPHSEIPGSTSARLSPGLFAACHVLHRLLAPRHPPNALTSTLDRSTRRSQGQTPPANASRMKTLFSKARSRRLAAVSQNASDLLLEQRRRRMASALPDTPSSRCQRSRRAPTSATANFGFARSGPPRPAAPPRGAPGGGERVRTVDLLLAKQALSQLSYTPKAAGRARPPGTIAGAHRSVVVGQGGFEPPTSRLSSARSNQLSY